MRLTKTFLATALILGCVGSASAQRAAPKPTSEAPPVVTVGTRFDGQTVTRVLRLEYQLRILAQYNPGAMRVLRVYEGGPATRLMLAGPQRIRGTLEPGDVITHVDGRRIYSVDDYYLAMYLSGTRNGRVRLRVRDVNSGRYFTWDAVAQKVGGTDRDRPLPQNARPATRVKALIIGLTYDKAIGEGCGKNLDNLSRYLRGLPNFDPKTDLTVLAGRNVTARNILRAVAALRVGPTETLFCYYAGHGAYDPNLALGDPSGGHHFQIPGGDLMRKDLLNALRDKGAQLTVLISDTCNVRGLYTPPTMTTPEEFLPPPLKSKVFADLLYNYVGVVDVSGSTRGQYGWFTRDGGWFTLGLLATLEKSTRTDGWSAFLEETSKNVSGVFQVRKRLILGRPEPKEEAAKKELRKLAAQTDQRPQTFTLTVRRVRN
jgi:hypothetical protein